MEVFDFDWFGRNGGGGCACTGCVVVVVDDVVAVVVNDDGVHGGEVVGFFGRGGGYDLGGLEGSQCVFMVFSCVGGVLAMVEC